MANSDEDYDPLLAPLEKRQKRESALCILCNKHVPLSNLTRPKHTESWRTLVDAATIRRFGPILELDTQAEGIPDIYYETSCRNNFIHKKSLDKLRAETDHPEHLNTYYKRTHRETGTSKSRTYSAKCIFCDKDSKYVRRSHTREKLTQSVELRADKTVRVAACRYLTQERSESQRSTDDRILAITSRDIVAAEAQYHRSCYLEYTRQKPHRILIRDDEDESYTTSESFAYQQLFYHIRHELIAKPHIAQMTDLTEKLVSYMNVQGITNIKAHTKKHIRRKLEAEFGHCLNFFIGNNNRLLVIPDNLTIQQLARDYMTIKEKLDLYSSDDHSMERALSKTAINLRKIIKAEQYEQPWPHELDEQYVNTPKPLKLFITTLLTGNRDSEVTPTARVQKLVWSLCQDLMYAVSLGQMKTSKHILLPWAVKTLTGNVELIQILNRLGHGISYSKLEEIDTALCLHKLEQQAGSGVLLPTQTYAGVPTVLAYDNIDRQEETLSGAGTSHRVNGIIVQPRVSTALPPPHQTVMQKDKKRSLPTIAPLLPHYNCSERKCPPAITPLHPAEAQTEATVAKNKNLAWSLVRQSDPTNQQTSSWTGFNILTSDNVDVKVDKVGYLPTINAPATQMSTVHKILEQTKEIVTALHLQEVICVFDQALYAKATEIVWQDPRTFQNVILRMGTFHTICNMLSIIGKRFGEAGLRDMAVEAGVIAEGSINSVIEGRQYNRGVRLHKIIYEALMRLLWKGFQDWIEEKHNDDLPELRHMVSLATEVHAQTDNQSLSTLLDDISTKQIILHFREYENEVRHTCGPLASFWMSYLDLVEILLALIRASREGNWLLHLHAIRSMIPWCFAYDKQNYARYLSIYHAQMTRLEADHPVSHQQLLEGRFSVQLSENNTFGRIPVDQTVEETVNRDTQTSGGTRGFSLKQTAVSKYYLTAEHRSTCIRQLRALVEIRDHGINHPDLGAARIQKDERDVQSVVEVLECNWINPFISSTHGLMSISSGIMAPTDVASDLITAQDVGEKAYQLFVDSRLKTGTSFYYPLKKLQLKSFSSLKIKKKTKSTNKETVLKADYHLFSRMLLIASCRKMDMKEVLRHPLGPLPWSLANCDGSAKKTNKAALARNLETRVSSDDHTELPSATIIDGIGLVYKMRGDNMTFSELSEHLRNVLQTSTSSSRVDIVFDRYNEVSIKTVERLQRGAEGGMSFAKIIPGHKIRSWRRLLACPASKAKLTNFFATDWQENPERRSQLQGKVIFVTFEDKCFKISTTTITEVDSLKCTHEEADTRLLLHTHHAAESGYKSVTLVVEDTDVMILCLAFSGDGNFNMHIRCGTKNRCRLISISKLAATLGHGVCTALLGLHAFTGCDSSSFSGQGKIKALKLMEQNQSFQEAFTTLGEQWHMTDELFEILQEFTCKLYAARTNIIYVNELRYQLWRAKKGAVESGQLPPCEDSLRQHALRANYQSAVWRRSLVPFPDVPHPQDGHGWTAQQGGQLEVHWMTGSPAPQVILEFISCKCTKICQLPKCECLSSGLPCTEECKLQTCTNMKDSDTTSIDSDDEVDEDDFF